MTQIIDYLVTGAAGFIGNALTKNLAQRGLSVVGIDNLNSYYSVELKQDRILQLTDFKNVHFEKIDVADATPLNGLFQRFNFRKVVHLAAQAGVRYSIDNPGAYCQSNLVGFLNVLEACRYSNMEHLVYASSSSVYGSNTKLPFAVEQSVDHPVSLYAATKKANELMAHAYSHLFRMPTTGLRFFTVYGPWGRPDMAAFIFTKAIIEGKPIKVFNHGKMSRDFTFIDDIVEAIFRVSQQPAEPDSRWSSDSPSPGRSAAPFRVYNIGNRSSVRLDDFIGCLEQAIGIKAIKEMVELQPGDVLDTYADIVDLEQAIGFHPTVSVQEGVSRFVSWYREYYNV